MKTTSRWIRGWASALPALALSLLAACGGGGGNEPANSGDNGSGGNGGNGGNGAPIATEFVAVGSSARTASLGWKPVSGATGYTLERKTGASAYAPIATLGADADTFIDDGLAQNTAYDYRLVPNGANAAPAEQQATTSADLPVVSAIGPAIGNASSGTVDAAGGQLATAAGDARLTLPSGAVPTGTAVSLQPIANTAPDGIGDGVHVHVAALPSQPLTLTLSYDATLDGEADGIGIALQRSDGSWLTLPVTTIDKAQRTLSAKLPPSLARGATNAQPQSARNAAAAATVSLDATVIKYLNFHLSPRQAVVETNKTQLLVPYARTLVAYGHICLPDEEFGCLPMPLLEKREVPFENSKAGYTRRWFVWAEEGGNAADGTITPRAGTGAIYKAPAKEPSPNPVIVTFSSKHDKSGRTITLTSSIRVKERVWTGTIHGTLEQHADLGFAFSAEAVWTRDANGTYRATGTQSVHVINYTCYGTPSPATVPLPPGALTIDSSVEPPRYTLDVGSIWNTVISGYCPGNGSGSVPMEVPGRLVVEGTLGGNGTKIEGTTSQNHITWDWALTSEL
jgi:hypothetical protein